MITVDSFNDIVIKLGKQALDDIDWAEGLRAPSHPGVFALETIYVICNSGMKHTVARGIYERVSAALKAGQSAHSVFRHKGKSSAIDYIWDNKLDIYLDYLIRDTDEQRLEFLAKLPWIGGITKYHIAKNFGLDVAKPDVHLQRLADREQVTAQQLCERIAKETGYRVATVDTLLWRACATGVLNSRTGEVAI